MDIPDMWLVATALGLMPRQDKHSTIYFSHCKHWPCGPRAISTHICPLCMPLFKPPMSREGLIFHISIQTIMTISFSCLEISVCVWTFDTIEIDARIKLLFTKYNLYPSNIFWKILWSQRYCQNCQDDFWNKRVTVTLMLLVANLWRY